MLRIALLITLLCSVANAGEEFVTSFWLGPPEKFTTIERYREIREANFTVAFPPLFTPSPALNHKILDLCQQAGLKAMIADARVMTSPDAVAADYRDHPALYGYFVVDEPSAGDFPKLGKVNADLKKADPNHPGFINLFPTYAAPGAQLGTKTYEEYVDQFIEKVRPAWISFDHYPFIDSGDRTDFFYNLAVIRNAGTKSNLPFWSIALCVQHLGYRHLTEGELRSQAMAALAFGAHGLLWYTYWYPGEPNPTIAHAMINYDGSRDPHFDMIRQINADARAIGTELLSARSWATYHLGEAPQLQPPAGESWLTATGGQLTIGLFTCPDGKRMALVANRDYRKPCVTRLTIPHADGIERFDANKRSWSPAALDAPLELPEAGAILLRWR